jgi:DNA-binding MarR family transcriptional regulator
MLQYILRGVIELTEQSMMLREILRQLERRLGLIDDSTKSCCGISLAQCHALVEIGRASDISLNSLASLLNLDKSTTSRSVDHLVRHQFAQRKTDHDNRRRISICLTPAGQRLFCRIEDDMARYYAAVAGQIEPDRRVQVIESLGILLDAIEKTDSTGQFSDDQTHSESSSCCGGKETNGYK